MKICCVVGCNGPKEPEPVFFEFPTSRLLRRRWLDAIEAPPKLSPDALVCSRHFRSEDYVMIRGKVRLKSKVVPFASETHDNSEISHESTETAESDKNTETATNDEDNHNGNNVKPHSDKESAHNEKCHNDNAHKDNYSDSKVHNEIVDNDKDNNDNIDSDKINNDKVVHEKENNEIGHNIIEITDKADNEKENSDVINNEKGHNEVGHNEKENNEIGHNEKENSEIGHNEKENNEIVHNGNGKVVNKSRKTRCKITPRRGRVTNHSESSGDSSSSQDSVASRCSVEPPADAREDIEGILTHYYIENKKTERQVAAMTDVLQETDKHDDEELEIGMTREPVFIELSVGQEANPSSPANDCLMVLESVECAVDPALLLAARDSDGGDSSCEKVDLADDDDDDDVADGPVGDGPSEKVKQDPISLLTSSDDDDVIIQEPKIDTVEVSSADTDEDDVPLVKLVKTPKRAKVKNPAEKKRAKNLITKILWGGSDFYCVQCRFTTVSSAEYTKHMNTHSKVLQLCPDCGFTTSSKAQMSRHKQKHKNEKRYKCPRCHYTAKHKMSLVYHMKTHKNIRDVEIAICGTFEPPSKVSRFSKASENGKSESVKSGIDKNSKKHACGSCDYRTNRNSDLKRHRMRVHRKDEDDEGDDEEYIP